MLCLYSSGVVSIESHKLSEYQTLDVLFVILDIQIKLVILQGAPCSADSAELSRPLWF